MNGIMLGITGIGSRHFLKAAKKGACFKPGIKVGEKHHEKDPWGLVWERERKWNHSLKTLPFGQANVCMV